MNSGNAFDYKFIERAALMNMVDKSIDSDSNVLTVDYL